MVVVEVTEEQLEGGGGGRVETRPALLSVQRGGPQSSWSSAEEDLEKKISPRNQPPSQ